MGFAADTLPLEQLTLLSAKNTFIGCQCDTTFFHQSENLIMIHRTLLAGLTCLVMLTSVSAMADQANDEKAKTLRLMQHQ
ncbi:MAG: hypothetical protein CVU31_00345 [Betaproteobacteria bacterium HGW-Betaproteobacteria-4]|jgi:hypothetical protein|nr:MAG: hypothetical protein CVU31_00345 [Betaproteobacteria bacterium HGW-Betaproteobacteria-4]